MITKYVYMNAHVLVINGHVLVINAHVLVMELLRHHLNALGIISWNYFLALLLYLVSLVGYRDPVKCTSRVPNC